MLELYQCQNIKENLSDKYLKDELKIVLFQIFYKDLMILRLLKMRSKRKKCYGIDMKRMKELRGG